MLKDQEAKGATALLALYFFSGMQQSFVFLLEGSRKRFALLF